MSTLFQDLRYGLRMLAKNPGFTAVAVVTLALGIGANTAIFTVVNAALLHPLPFKDPDRLVTLWGINSTMDYSGPATVCDPDYADWRAQDRVFDEIAGFRGQMSSLTGVGDPVRLLGSEVTASFFPLLGVTTVVGRAFSPDEERPGSSRVVLLSYKLWVSRLSSDRGVVGKTLKLDGELFTVVGVMPAGFGFPNQGDFWTPVVLAGDCRNRTLQVIARLKRGVTIGRARKDVAAIAQHQDEERHRESGWHISLVPLAEVVARDLRPSLLVLLGAVALVLVIACANVANLLLARASSRQHEVAIRNALGASRLRIIRQMLTESVLLAIFGGLFGLLLATWAHDFLGSSISALPRSLGTPSVLERIVSTGVDRWVLGFTFVTSVLTGVLFGLAPAIQASRPDLNETLKEGGRGLATGRGKGRVRSLLIVGEVALALVLLVSAGLLIRSFWKLVAVDPGFNPEKVLTLNVALPESRYQSEIQMIEFEQQAIERLQGLPGVESAGAVFGLPLGDILIRGDFTIEGQPPPPPQISPSKEVASADYFRAIGIPLVKGRDFNDQDKKDSPRVAIISQSMARRFWLHEDPLGRRIDPGFSASSWCRIVGVVGDVKQHGLDEGSSLAIYLPYAQSPSAFLMRNMAFAIRTRSDPRSVAAAVRQAIEGVDPDLPVFDIATMEQLVYRSVSEPRLNAVLLGLFASLALALASVGIYGVTSYAVIHRTHEIGVRMALGADRGQVLNLIVREGMLLTCVGVGAGLVVAFGVTRLMRSLMYGVRPSDPGTFAAAAIALAAVALLACYIPARRATKVDPMVALRYE